MRTNIVLIDFENVQPESVDLLEQDHFRVVVFVGANQTRVPFETAASLQRLGSRAEYLKISGSGSNALDLHIAYRIGTMSAADPTAVFHIVSKDTGFDPLIQFLKTKKTLAGRVAEISDIPAIKVPIAQTPEERVKIVIDRLVRQTAAKPKTVKTLANSIASIFQKQLAGDEVNRIIGSLAKRGIISVAGTKVTYTCANDA